MIELYLIAIVGILLFTRITGKTAKARFSVTESGANAYEEADINFPITILANGKVIAGELLRYKGIMDYPSSEPGQKNSLTMQIVKDSQTDIIAYTDLNVIDKHKRQNSHEDAAGTEAQLGGVVNDFDIDLRDTDGVGELVLEETLHVGLKGVGNIDAKSAEGYLEYHLVELSATEVVMQFVMDEATD